MTLTRTRPARLRVAPATALVVAVAVAVGVAVLVWVVRHGPRSTLPETSAVSVSGAGSSGAPVRLDRADATRLAGIVDGLPKPFDETSCPGGFRSYVLRFATAEGPITVVDHLDGCASVDITSGGSTWVDKWEPDHRLRDLVRQMICAARPARC